MKRPFAFLSIGLATSLVGAVSAVAQTASALYEFRGGSTGDGDEPTVLIQAQDGNFYGITAYGGNASGCTDDNGVPTGCGTIFKISPGGSESVLYKFSGGTDGGIPNSLIQGPDGNIYGTTLIGGQPPSSPNQCNISSPSNPGQTAGPCCPPDSNGDAVGCGTIFVFAPTQAASVTPTTLYSFTGTADGGSPGTLIVGTNSSGARLIFGTTLSCSNCFYPSSSGLFYPTGGTIFSFALPVSTPFKPNTLATFSTQLAEFPKLGTNANLAFPNSLIQTDQNTLYGTTQMGGVTSTGQNAVCQTEFGCGGVFELELASSNLVDICHFGDLIDVTPPAIGACNSADVPQPASLPQAQAIEKSGKPSPEIIVAQSGVRFPTGGSLWGFTTEPIALVADSNGNIYGTTPPGCVDPSYSLPYTSDPNCASDHPDDFVNAVQGTVFELTPSTGSVTFPYSFSGNGPSPTSPPSDGGGSEAGITLATDGNFYGLSGDGASSFYGLSGVAGLSSEVFELPVLDGNLTNYTSLSNPNLVGSNPNWMIQGSNGNFYGTSSTELFVATCGLLCGSGTRFGSVFQVTPPSPLNPPVGLSFNSPQIALGNPATLTWTVPYAYSLTSRQCYAFVEGTNASTAGAWSGLQSGSLSNKVYGGSIAITPTAFGNYTYALTCGGIVSGQATLQVNGPLTISPTTLPDATVGIAYSATLTPGGGSGSGYEFSITSGSSSLAVLGLNLAPATGVISGTPPGAGTASFTVELTDSAGDNTSQTYTIAVNAVTAPYPFAGMASSDGNGPTVLIQALDGNFYGITSFGGGGGANCVNNAGSGDGCGTIFRFAPGGTKDTVLHSFTGGADGGIPSSLVQGQDGNIYVATMIGGPDTSTSNPNSTALNICTDPDTSDAEPCCTRAHFSGATLTASPVTCGAIFEFNPSQSAPVTPNPLYTFIGGTDGASPGTLILGSTVSEPEVIFGTTLACSYCGTNSSDQDFGDAAGFNIYGTVFNFVPVGSTAVTPATIATLPHLYNSPPYFMLAYPNSLIQSGLDTLYGTTQMGGQVSSTDTNCPANSDGSFGCGGVFDVSISGKNIAELCDFGVTTGGSCFTPATVAGEPVNLSSKAAVRARPEIVVVQSGARFPVGGIQWSYTTVPIALAMDSGGNIYGTTPPGCANGGTYLLDPNCSADFQNNPPAEVSSVFKLAPPLTSGSASSLDTLYSFPTGSGGSGTEAGIALAADGNFYGASGGAGSPTSEVFNLASGGISSYASLSNTDTPTWLIQGADGNLWGTSLTGGNGFGSIFEVKPPTPLPLPVQLSFADSPIDLGSTATITWRVPNAFSITSEQCYPFVQPNQTGAGTWSAPGTASMTDGVYSDSATITPTKTGTFNYAVTCGGNVSGYISLTVNPALTITPTSVPAGTAGTPYSQSLTPGGGSGTGYQFSITVGASTLTALGLSLSTAGVISGTPTGGTATFTVQLTDSLNDSTTQAYTLIVNKVTPTITWAPASTIIHGGAGSNVLNAGANTSGSFTYSATPTGGGSAINITGGTSTLPVGNCNIAANFTPTNTGIYGSAQATATLLVSGESVWIVNSTGGLSELAGNGYGITSSADPGANRSVSIDSSGNVWTIGSGSTLLEETSQVGTTLTSIPSGTGGLGSPAAIAIDGDGQIWIVNGDNSVSLFSNAGTALSPSTGFTGAALSTPSGVAVDLSGSVWITNKGTNSVTRILGAAAPAEPLATAAANKTTGAKP